MYPLNQNNKIDDVFGCLERRISIIVYWNISDVAK